MEGIHALFSCGAMGSWTDGHLVEQFLSTAGEGANSAFRVLLHRHGPMVLGICRRVLGDEHAAEDAFQATFLVLMKKAGSLRDRNQLSHWLYGVALRVASEEKAKIARRRVVERRAGRRIDGPPGDPGQAELGSVIDEEIGRLPERYRAPLVLCHLEGLRHDEVAHRLGCPLGTVESRLSRAREKLQLRLTRRGLAPTALAFEPLRSWPVGPKLVEATLKSAGGVSAHRAGVGLASAWSWSVAGRLLPMVSGNPITTVVGILAMGSALGAMSLRALPSGDEPRIAAEPPPASAPAQDVTSPDLLDANRAPITRPTPAPSPAKDETPRASRSPAALARALTGITVDGRLDDWPRDFARHPIRNQALGFSTYDSTPRSTGRRDPDAYFLVGYDPEDELIYLAVVVRDDELVILEDVRRTDEPILYASDAVEVFVAGRDSGRKASYAAQSGDWRDGFDARTMPALQYVAVPGPVSAYADRSGSNPSLLYGRIERTKTKMAYRRDGNLTTYEWAIQAFDRYPDRSTRLQPGKAILFDVAVVEKGREGPPAYLTWGPPPKSFKGGDAAQLGELVLAGDAGIPYPVRPSSGGP
jgi:RNA polymerase sigma factor (sigma-70 family)